MSILASCSVSPTITNSVLEELRVTD